MKKPTRLWDIQKFTGCLASLSRFVSGLGEKALPLYQLMKKTICFEWTDQADKAFLQLKRMLSTLPVLAAPAPKEPMLFYITATNRVVNRMIVVKRPEAGRAQPVQRHVYYLSEVLSASKQNYPHYQKMCCSMYFTAKMLKQYFEEHTITVIHFAASNNMAEYEALVHGLLLAKEIDIRRILCYSDSDLVVQ
ncbi:uncharacterized protein [Aegilops tauschii subsp. strangulata]|uniref:uncharacterized protein n=1 Tax=Aegilops tauschii subsp. strangulata TaxID=200361 RepID=UPI003CC8AFED